MPDPQKTNGKASGSYDEYAAHKAEEAAATFQDVIEAALKRQQEDPGALFERPVLAAIAAARSASPAMYERIRNMAKECKASVGRLDKLTEIAEDEDTPHASMFPVDVPWTTPVTAADLLALLAATLARFVVADPATLLAAALFIMHTWVFDVFTVSPLAHIHSPEKRCGKTTLLMVMARLVCRPLATSNITPAALFRAVEKWQPTLLIDEADTFLNDNDEARGLVNSGLYRETAYVIRAEGDDFKPTMFATWAPKVLCGIGRLADSTEDRRIPLRMRRKLPCEKRDHLRRSPPALWLELRAKLARWAEDAVYELKRIQPRPVPGLNDRAQDCWEPLALVALMAAGDWPKMANAAAQTLYGVEEDAPTIGAELLKGIKEAFTAKDDADKLSSAELMDTLNANPEAPWCTWNHGKPMTVRQLASKLSDYGIHSKGIRLGDKTPKGYERKDFEDAFTYYLSNSAQGHDTSATPQQPHNGAASECFLTATENGVLRIENGQKPLGDNGCGDVADKSPEKGQKEDRQGAEPDQRGEVLL